MHQKNDPIPTYKHKAFSCASKGYVYIYIYVLQRKITNLNTSMVLQNKFLTASQKTKLAASKYLKF